jgi:FMN phosphatase YigB (HAD superfamily)
MQCAADQLVVFDIDNTLMVQRHGVESEFVLRPDAAACLRFCFRRFRWVALWTANHSVRIDQLLAMLDREWTRSDFLFTWCEKRLSTRMWPRWGYCKSLAKIFRQAKYRRLGITRRNTYIVDDCAEYCAQNYGNHIAIESFTAEMLPYDRRLSQLMRFFESVDSYADDVRPLDKRSICA